MVVLGYGNPSRGDDALGPDLVAELEARRAARPEWGDMVIITDFQLQVEHAADLEGHALALFLDAAASGPAPYGLEELAPAEVWHHTTHALPPAAVLAVYRRVYGPPPPAFLLRVKGESFELGEALTPAAAAHKAAALELLDELLARPDPAAWRARCTPSP